LQNNFIFLQNKWRIKMQMNYQTEELSHIAINRLSLADIANLIEDLVAARKEIIELENCLKEKENV
jgi:hypothetical protein